MSLRTLTGQAKNANYEDGIWLIPLLRNVELTIAEIKIDLWGEGLLPTNVS